MFCIFELSNLRLLGKYMSFISHCSHNTFYSQTYPRTLSEKYKWWAIPLMTSTSSSSSSSIADSLPVIMDTGSSPTHRKVNDLHLATPTKHYTTQKNLKCNQFAWITCKYFFYTSLWKILNYPDDTCGGLETCTT